MWSLELGINGGLEKISMTPLRITRADRRRMVVFSSSALKNKGMWISFSPNSNIMASIFPRMNKIESKHCKRALVDSLTKHKQTSKKTLATSRSDSMS